MRFFELIYEAVAKVIFNLPAFGPMLIALFVAYIAYQQWSMGRTTLLEKLFERRFEVFKETQKFLTMLTSNDSDLDDKIWGFTDVYQRSRFLFGKEICEYLGTIQKRDFDTQFQKSVMENPTAYDDSMVQIHKYGKNKRWYFSQLTVIFISSPRIYPLINIKKTNKESIGEVGARLTRPIRTERG